MHGHSIPVLARPLGLIVWTDIILCVQTLCRCVACCARFDTRLPTNKYKLDLSTKAGRLVAARLTAINNLERAERSALVDTSQHGNRDNFRNTTLDGETFHPPTGGDLQPKIQSKLHSKLQSKTSHKITGGGGKLQSKISRKISAKGSSSSSSASGRWPDKGILKTDFVSVIAPPPTTTVSCLRRGVRHSGCTPDVGYG